MNIKNQVRRSTPGAPWLWSVTSFAVATLLATSAAAQVSSEEVWSDEIPAHLSVVEGVATLERDGVVESAASNLILLTGDRLRTDRGRVEILFADGSAIAVDEFSTVDLLDATLMRLLEGRVRMTIARASSGIEYRVDTVAGSALLLAPGDYRLALSGTTVETTEVDLDVLHGSAELANELGRTLVRAGTHAVTRANTAPSLPYTSNSAFRDAFDVWADEQQEARLGYESTRYLPAELRYDAGTFDRDGAWAYQPAYGYVWYPAVPVGWRPYSEGRWSFAAHFGWVWVGASRWSWTTHHYGRWGVNQGRWYWIPDRRWGPGWVSWATAPGYVGWCPLGFNGRPVFAVTTISIRYADPWFGWTVLPSNVFRPNVNVHVTRYAVPRGRTVPGVWSQFALERTAPARPAAVTPRSAPLRSPSSGTAVPRAALATGSTTPRLTTSRAQPDTGRTTVTPRATAATTTDRRTASSRSTAALGGSASRASAPTPRATIPASGATTRNSATPGRPAAGRSVASGQQADTAATSRSATSRATSSASGSGRSTVRPPAGSNSAPVTSAPVARARTLPSQPPRATSGSRSTAAGMSAPTGSSRTATSRSVATPPAGTRPTVSRGAASAGVTSRSTGATVSSGSRRGGIVSSRPGNAAPPSGASRVGGATARSAPAPSTSRSTPGARSAPRASAPPPRSTSGGGRAAPPSTAGTGRTASRRGGGGGGGS